MSGGPPGAVGYVGMFVGDLAANGFRQLLLLTIVVTPLGGCHPRVPALSLRFPEARLIWPNDQTPVMISYTYDHAEPIEVRSLKPDMIALLGPGTTAPSDRVLLPAGPKGSGFTVIAKSSGSLSQKVDDLPLTFRGTRSGRLYAETRFTIAELRAPCCPRREPITRDSVYQYEIVPPGVHLGKVVLYVLDRFGTTVYAAPAPTESGHHEVRWTEDSTLRQDPTAGPFSIRIHWGPI